MTYPTTTLASTMLPDAARYDTVRRKNGGGDNRFLNGAPTARGCCLTPRQYAAAHRANTGRDVLTEAASLSDATFNDGYKLGSRLTASAHRQLSMAPAAFRNGGRSESARFALGACSLGSILVGATANGVCAILLGGDPDRLVRDLQDRWPNAKLLDADEKFNEIVAHIVGAIDAARCAIDLPLDIRGTTFQRLVWDALTRIPSGSTSTYAEIAATIGRPSAARAVARACAANILAVAIPCHRVIRSDGSPSGYRWGAERKIAMRNAERAA